MATLHSLYTPRALHLLTVSHSFPQEEIQKLAAQIEFMKIVNMEINNRHIKPKPGGYFSMANVPNFVQSPMARPAGCLLSKPPEELWRVDGNSGGDCWFKLGRHGSEKDTRKPVFVWGFFVIVVVCIIFFKKLYIYLWCLRLWVISVLKPPLLPFFN